MTTTESQAFSRTVDRVSTAQSMFWSVIENGSLSFISLLSLIVYSRLLSAEDFGLFSIVFAITELLSLVTGMLFHDALVQRPVITPIHFDTAFSITLGLSFSITVICWLVAPAFGEWINQPAAGPLLSWMSFCFPISGLTATIVAQKRRDFGFRELALRSIIGRLSGGVIGIIAAFSEAGTWSLVIQQIVTAVLGSIVLWHTCHALPRLRFRWMTFKELIVFGISSVATVFLLFANRRLFTILIGVFLGNLTAGFVNLSFRVVDMLWSIAGSAIVQVALPTLSNLQSDPLRLKRAFRTAITFTCVILYPIFAGLSVTAPEVVQLVFGQQWKDSAIYVSILSLLIIIQVPKVFVVPLLSAVGRPHDALFGFLVQLLFMMGMMLLFGRPTVSWAMSIWIGSELIIIPIHSSAIKSATGFTIIDQFSGALVPFIATVIMSLTLLVIRQWLLFDLNAILRLSTMVVAGIILFAGSLYAIDSALAKSVISFGKSSLARKSKADC